MLTKTNFFSILPTIADSNLMIVSSTFSLSLERNANCTLIFVSIVSSLIVYVSVLVSVDVFRVFYVS